MDWIMSSIICAVSVVSLGKSSQSIHIHAITSHDQCT